MVFAASHRRLPHVGSKVAFLTDELLREIAGHNMDGAAELGHLAFGEFIYAEGDLRLKAEPWMRVRAPLVVPKFHVANLVSRRTFVFARAGFGKSNLVKLLFSNLYRTTPTVRKRGRGEVPVGTADGEYFWPDDKGRPGLCDVPELQHRLVVFTPKDPPSPFYGSFVAGSIKLDIRRLRPADVVSTALSPEKQDQQNVRKLKGMNDTDWHELVDLIHRDGNAADGDTIKRLLRLEEGQDAEMVAARANMTTIVEMLHAPSSQTMDMLLTALQEGCICVVDVSQLRGGPAFILSGLVLRKIFDHNQEEFTEAKPATIPVIAVVEEAQAVLGGGRSAEDAYVAWVKEGRKYDLGVLLITQQPGSIPGEILSQGDNWFVFHLLSTEDLRALKSANAHYSDDLLASLLNEPISGHCVFWSSVGGKSYPLPIRVLSFEGQHRVQDPEYNRPAVETTAVALRKRFDQAFATAQEVLPRTEAPVEDAGEDDGEESPDVLETYKAAAIAHLRNDVEFLDRIRRDGIPWRGVVEHLEQSLPALMGSDRNKIAHHLVPRAMDEILGEGGWKTEKRPSKSKEGGKTTWIVATSRPQHEGL